jgi:hypothetical protein
MTSQAPDGQLAYYKSLLLVGPSGATQPHASPSQSLFIQLTLAATGGDRGRTGFPADPIESRAQLLRSVE